MSEADTYERNASNDYGRVSSALGGKQGTAWGELTLAKGSKLNSIASKGNRFAGKVVDFLKAPQTTTTDSKSQTRAVFDQQGQQVLDAFKDRLGGQEMQGDERVQALRQSGVEGLGNTKIQAGSVLPTTKAQVEAVQAQSQANLPKQIAQARSQSYGSPVGRGDINIADTIARNQATENAAVAGIYNDANKFDQSQNLDAQKAQANVETTKLGAADVTRAEDQSAQNAKDQQYLDLLKLLRGEDTNKQETVKNKASGAQMGGQIIGGIASMFCWLARAVYGVDNPKWILYRIYLMNLAPWWYKVFYMTFARQLAPLAKRNKRFGNWVRNRMDKTLDKHKDEIEKYRKLEVEFLVIISN